jgi:hypothetical protein
MYNAGRTSLVRIKKEYSYIEVFNCCLVMVLREPGLACPYFLSEIKEGGYVGPSEASQIPPMTPEMGHTH